MLFIITITIVSVPIMLHSHMILMVFGTSLYSFEKNFYGIPQFTNLPPSELTTKLLFSLPMCTNVIGI